MTLTIYRDRYTGNEKNVTGEDGKVHMISEDWSVHRIHNGNRFTTSEYDTIQNGEIHTIVIIPGSEEMHFVFSVRTTDVTTIQFYEDVTILSSGTVLPIFNRNRNSANETDVVVLQSGTLSSSGTAIFNYGVSTAVKVGGNHIEDEWILNNDYIYAVQLVSEANSNRVTIELDWYTKD